MDLRVRPQKPDGSEVHPRKLFRTKSSVRLLTPRRFQESRRRRGLTMGRFVINYKACNVCQSQYFRPLFGSSHRWMIFETRHKTCFATYLTIREIVLHDDMTADDIPGWDSLTHINLMVAWRNGSRSSSPRRRSRISRRMDRMSEPFWPYREKLARTFMSPSSIEFNVAGVEFIAGVLAAAAFFWLRRGPTARCSGRPQPPRVVARVAQPGIARRPRDFLAQRIRDGPAACRSGPRAGCCRVTSYCWSRPSWC